MAPIIDVGTSSTSKAPAKRTAVRTPNSSPIQPCADPYQAGSRCKTGWVASAVTAIASSAAANSRNGCERAGGDPAGHEAADRQARHEPGEHGAGRVGGHTEDERQQPQPENLIGQACGAGAAQREQENEESSDSAGSTGHRLRRGLGLLDHRRES